MKAHLAAALVGAAVLKQAEVLGLNGDEDTGKITRALMRENISSETVNMHQKVAFNATEPLLQLNMQDGVRRCRPDGGEVLPDYFSLDSTKLTVGKSKDGRVISMLPGLGNKIAGRVDAASEVAYRLEPQEAETELILEALNGYLGDPLLGRTSGFAVAPIHRPCTKGVWMWSQPMARTAADGSAYHLVLLDSEGIDAYDQTGTYSVQIFSLAVLLFSMFVYNQMGGIDEAALDRLSLVTEMSITSA